jgi:flagellar biosynthesis protein FlhF
MLLRFEGDSVTAALREARDGAGPRAVLVRVERQGSGGVVVYAKEEAVRGALERQLRARGIVSSRRQELLAGLSEDDPTAARAELRARLERLVPQVPWAKRSRPGPRILAFVGPTGVGKTTTIAKVAGREQLDRKLSVGLVTLDLYRVAAVDQLRAYAELLGAPLEVAGTPAELTRALERFARKDLVLVDTAGRSPLDAKRIEDLASFLRPVPELETLLVLSAATRRRELTDALRRFAPCSPTGLVLTKLDEVVVAGDLLELVARLEQPVRLLAAGQEVPDDLELASPGRIAEWVLGPGKKRDA